MGPPGDDLVVLRRRRWPWVAGAGAVAVLAAVGVGGALLLSDDGTGDDGADGAYCAALAEPARVDIPMIVFVEAGLDEAEVAPVRTLLEERDDILELRYVGRDEAFAEAQELFADRPATVPRLRPEDVPTSFRLVARDIDAAEAIRDRVEDEDVVEQVEELMFAGDTAEEVIRFLALQDDIEVGINPGGRFGSVVDPELGERLLDAVPDAVAEDLATVLGPLTDVEVETDEGYGSAALAIVTDAEARCE